MVSCYIIYFCKSYRGMVSKVQFKHPSPKQRLHRHICKSKREEHMLFFSIHILFKLSLNFQSQRYYLYILKIIQVRTANGYESYVESHKQETEGPAFKPLKVSTNLGSLGDTKDSLPPFFLNHSFTGKTNEIRTQRFSVVCSSWSIK